MRNVKQKGRSSYILEHDSEGERLEYQACQRNYLPGLDFPSDELRLESGMTVLDAGCGSGLISRMVVRRNPNKDLEVIAVDSSESRIKEAEKRAEKEGIFSIKFRVGDIKQLDMEDESVDLVVSRFVYEHNPHSFEAITNEAYRVVRPGRLYYIVDTDGIWANIEGGSPQFQTLNKKLIDAAKDFFEPFPCRKIPRYLAKAGFRFSSPRHVPMLFIDPYDIQYEEQLWKMRFKALKPLIDRTLGSKAKWYIDQFFKELWDNENFIYYNRFVFCAQKPF